MKTTSTSTLTDDVKALFSKFFTRLGSIINQSPAKKENVKTTSTSQVTKNENIHAKKENEPMPKDTYGYKGSGYKGKGNVNTDARVFNHPRR